MPSRQARSRSSERLTAGQALVIGALHGPAELLPISSSAHVTLIPWLLGWRYEELDGELHKAFEVTLHAATAAAMLIALRSQYGDTLRTLDRQSAAVILTANAPPALAGYLFERPIERRLGTPSTIAAALLAGALAMAAADRVPQSRRREDAGPRDGLWLGAAQVCALIPGVSRNGATRTAARLLGFTRRDGQRLSSDVGLPVIVGASLLKALRLRGLQSARPLRSQFALGAAGAFVSTLAGARLLGARGDDAPLLPYAAYRVLLASMVLLRGTRSER